MAGVSPELRAWILATAGAGHDATQLLRLMQEAGYTLPQSRAALAEVLPAAMAAASSDGARPQHPHPPLADAGDRRVRIAASVEAPPLRLIQDLLDADECAALIAQARPRLARVRTVAEDGRQQIDARRTSAGMFFALGETPLVARIEQRIAALTGLPTTHGEGLQVLHYQPGQQYEPHYDWFDPAQPGFAAVSARGGQRVATVVIYLNTPEEGGGTAFPGLGLTFTALAGSAVYFAYAAGDALSLHAGLPVLRGEKWIATKWLRERPFG
ncbi:2OG-Fe(II) oxygenase [Aerosticca soli]|jgi:prolyl 4-hydroxylase|uniref:Peptidyl prolyl 4-hydroxylase alpha subunit n=1 Tax=Aerosticca soli TaxID=2010829 RepID=A0A2Z6E6K8_9GAMM|nr:2OG-Fe(II) oxygenase [Aerosticca soli]MDI3263161.1 2OG-Fe(II) oxygenase [Fulvimonas sp.]BBD80733.1 peptidyl prolyl 4-hydroxylase alpha subunit [Aerosticca soli]